MIKENVTVVFDDKLVIVDERPIKLSSLPHVEALSFFEKLHALVWDRANNDGDIQHYKGKAFINTDFTEEQYEIYVAPFVEAWEAQRVIEDTPIEEPELSLHEQALLLQMTKREFLKIVIHLTANIEGLTPITLAMIEAYVASADDSIRLEWDYATYIERKHPMLDVVAADPAFGISSDYLDVIFVNKDQILYAIDNNIPLG